MSSNAGAPDYELDDVMDIDTPQRVQALGDPLRSMVVDLLLQQAMSIGELAKATGKPRSTLAHHVEVLLQAELIKVVRTRKVRAIEERIYGRTARSHHHVGPLEGDQLPFVSEAQREFDWELAQELPVEFTLRRATIAASTADEFIDELITLSTKFLTAAAPREQEYGLLICLFPTNRPVKRETTNPDPTK